jgi:nucleoside-diphosphate-sugar epimerase
MENAPIAVVTGANGFVGSHLVDLLLSKGYEVRCITRKSSSLKWLDTEKVKIVDCGLFDREGLEKAFEGASYIYHVAGVVKSKKPEGYYKGNVETTRNVLETALKYKDTIKRVLIVSSQTVMGPTLDGRPKVEADECHPITTYGKSKLQGESLARRYMDRLPITICRACAVYGERDTEILIFFDTFNKGLMTTIGLKDKDLNLIHAIDLVKGIFSASISENSVGETYFIASEKIYNWEEIGKVTAKVLNKKPIRVKVPHAIVYTLGAIAQFFAIFSSKAATLNIEKARDIVQPAWTCTPDKAVKQLGWHQEISLEEGFSRTAKWYKEVGWLK